MNILIERVQLAFDFTNIIDVAVVENWLYMTIGRTTVVRIDLQDPKNVNDIQLPANKKLDSDSIRRLFLDPTATHLIVVTTANEHYYLERTATKFRHLPRLKGLQTISIAWNPGCPTSSPGTILLGTRQGIIYETEVEPSSDGYFSRDTKYLKTVWTSPHNNSRNVSGLYFQGDERFEISAAMKTRWAQQADPVSSVAMILSGNELYSLNVDAKFKGKGANPFKEVLAAPPTVYELSGSDSRAPLGILQVSPDRKYYAALYNGNLVFGPYDKSDSKVFTRQVSQDTKIILSTHLILVIEPSARTVTAVVSATNQVVSVANIPLQVGEEITGAISDASQKTYWLFGPKSLLEIQLQDEDAAVWSIYLKQGDFEEALNASNDVPNGKKIIYEAWGNHELKQGNYELAADYLGQSDASIEGVALALIKQNQLNALVKLFETRLSRTKSQAQQIVLTSWIVELYLQLGLSLSSLPALVEEKMHIPTIFEILANHGDDDQLVQFAEKVKDFKYLIRHWIASKKWSKVLEILREQEDEQAIYDYATLLLEQSPQETVESWMRITRLDASKLIPALMSYASSYRGASDNNQAIRYLRYKVSSASSVDLSIYNALVTLYALGDSDDELYGFLVDHAKQVQDYDFSLRMCLNHDKFRSAIFLYTLMDLFEEATNLALQRGYIEQAMEIVEKYVENEQLRESLWLKIAKQIITTKGPNETLQLIGKIKVENLLELFPDFNTLDALAPEVVKALEASNNELVSVDQEMQESLEASKGMQEEIAGFKKRYTLVEPGESCLLCMLPLAVRKFYVFPCQHGMHEDCLVSSIETGPDAVRRHKLSAAKSGTVPSEMAENIHNIVSEKCVLCSDSRIDLIDEPLVGEWA